MRLYIVQENFPAYRDPLWPYLINNKFRRHNLELVTLDSLNISAAINKSDSVIHTAFKVKNILSQVKFILMFQRSNRYILSQINYHKQPCNKVYLLKLCFYFLLIKIFTDNWISYYSYEYELLPACLKRTFNFLQLNNTVITSAVPLCRDSNSVLVLGRDTSKSNHTLIYNAINMLSKENKLSCDFKIYFIGATHSNSIKTSSQNSNIHYVNTYDSIQISNIANSCGYMLYAGDVGLSIIHGCLLGLVPAIHNSYNDHYPEAKALSRYITPLHFYKNSIDSISDLLLYMQSHPVAKTNRINIHKIAYHHFSPFNILS